MPKDSKPASPVKKPFSLDFLRKLWDPRANGGRIPLFLVFVICSGILFAILLARQPVATHDPYGDNYYYYKNAVSFSKVWSAPVGNFFDLVFHNVSDQRLEEIGFNHQVGFDSFFRAPSFLFFLSLWIAIFGGSEISCLIFMAVTLALVYSFVFHILRRKFSDLLAAMCLLFLLAYTPMLMIASMTFTEVFQTAAFLLLFIATVRTIEKEKTTWRWGIFLSLVLLSAMYSKRSYGYLFLVYLPFILFLDFRQNGAVHFRKLAIRLLIPFFLLFGLWGIISSNGSTPGNNGNTLEGWRVVWAGACLEADGHILYGGYHPEEFRKNINKGKVEFWFNRYGEVCRYAVFDYLKKNPVGYFSMMFKRLVILTTMPGISTTEHTFLLNIRKHYINTYQILLVVFFVLGFLFLRKEHFLLKAFSLLTLFYSYVIYAAANTDPRYLMPMIPFFIITALFFLYEAVRNKRWLMLGVLALLLSFAFAGTDKNILVSVTQNLQSLIFIKFAVFLAASTGIILILKTNNQEMFGKEHGLLNVLLIAATAVSLGCLTLNDTQVNHLTFKGQSASQKIILPALPDPRDTDSVFLSLDVRPIKPDAEFVININNRFLTNVKVTNVSVSISTDDANERLLQFHENHWIHVPLKLSLLNLTNTITIVKIKDCEVFYHLPSTRLSLPSMFNAYSVEAVYGAFTKRDGRLYVRTEVNSIGRSSIMGNGPKERQKDLDIFISVKDKGNYYMDRRYAQQLTQANIKYLALVNPIDIHVVFWSPQKPDPARFEPVTGNMKNYLMGEMDRYKSGITLY